MIIIIPSCFHQGRGEEKKNPSSRAYFLRVGLMLALLSRVRMFELMILVKSNVFVHLRALNGVTGKTMVRGRAILPTERAEPLAKRPRNCHVKLIISTGS